MLLGQGHEDLDQIFSVIASLITRYEFSNPEELISILDSAGRPEELGEHGKQERKRAKKTFTADCRPYKLDQTAQWHEWVSALGVRLKGLRPSHKGLTTFEFQPVLHRSNLSSRSGFPYGLKHP